MPKIDTCLTNMQAVSVSSVKPTADQQKDIAAMVYVVNAWKLGSGFGSRVLPLAWEDFNAAYEKARG